MPNDNTTPSFDASYYESLNEYLNQELINEARERIRKIKETNWIYSLPGWPNMEWDSKTMTARAEVIETQIGELLDKLAEFSEDEIAEKSARVIADDVVGSSLIEGEKLSYTDACMFLLQAHKEHMYHYSDADLDSDESRMAYIQMDANMKHSEPLTTQLLLEWHKAMFLDSEWGADNLTIGDYRKKNVYVGSPGRPVYICPPSISVDSEMRGFIDWYNHVEMHPLVKAGVAHFYFVVIHPFDDGNGRIGRCILDHALSAHAGTPFRCYAVSVAIEHDQRGYYDALKKTQKDDLDITTWLEWYFTTLRNAVDAGVKSLSHLR